MTTASKYQTPAYDEKEVYNVPLSPEYANYEHNIYGDRSPLYVLQYFKLPPRNDYNPRVLYNSTRETLPLTHPEYYI